MEQKHKEVIQKNYVNLVQNTHIGCLLPVLVEKGVFSSEMVSKYTGGDLLQRKRDLFLDVQKRGPEAFSNLVAALRETRQYNVANLLQPIAANNTEPRRHAVPFQLATNEDIPSYNPGEIQQLGENHTANIINLGTEPLRINVKLSTRLYDDPVAINSPVYSTHSKRRGFVLIINNIKYINDVLTERRGAEIDGRNLEELFYQMGFKVESHVNLTAAEMEQVIYDFKSLPQLRGVDMVFIIVMGHGHQNEEHFPTHITGIDNKTVTTLWIDEQFNNVHCKALQKVPKIIIYQTCRGTMLDYGVARRTENDSSVHSILRTRTDILTAYSTLPGTVSHRDIYLGTWYINIFCELMMNEAYNTDIESIFKKVDVVLSGLVSGKNSMQTASFYNKAFKTCFVHPGIYMEDGYIRRLPEVSQNYY